MMARYLLAACVARTVAFQAARTSRRALGAARALPPHLETVKADVAGGDALLLDVREPHEWAAAHFASATSAPLSALMSAPLLVLRLALPSALLSALMSAQLLW